MYTLTTQLFKWTKSFLPDVLPLQKPRNNPRRAGHERRRHHARHRRSVPHIRGAACLRVPVPALEAEVHQVRWWQMSVRLAEETSHVTVELSFRNSIWEDWIRIGVKNLPNMWLIQRKYVKNKVICRCYK